MLECDKEIGRELTDQSPKCSKEEEMKWEGGIISMVDMMYRITLEAVSIISKAGTSRKKNPQIKIKRLVMINNIYHEVKKNQRHTTNKKPNMYKDINKDNQYFGLSNRPSSG